jgi:hypothetical protein
VTIERVHRRIVWACAALAATAGAAHASLGCVPAMRQVGPPLNVSPGAPATPCERSDWIYLVPADVPRDNLLARRAPGAYRYASGVGAFTTLRPTTMPVDPLPIEAVLRDPLSPTLRRHHEPARRYRTRRLVGNGLMGAGSFLIACGFGLGAALADVGEDPTLPVGLFVGGLGGGLLSMLIGQALVPEGARAEMLFRDHLFYPQEDDMGEVVSGVAAHNARTRARCAAAPALPR